MDGTAIAAIGLLVSALMLVISLLTFMSAYRERNKKSIVEQTKMMVILDSNSEKLDNIESKHDELSEGYNRNRFEIIKLNTTIDGIEKRVHTLEKSVTNLEDRVREYHTKG